MNSCVTRIGIIALLAFCVCAGFSVLTVRPVFACSCVPPGKPSAELERATAVFSGEVSGIKAEGNNLVVQVNVEKVWKGAVARTVVIRTPKSSAACGYSFIKRKKYLVYAHGKEPLEVNLCSRTKPLESAAEDLKELGEGKQPN